MNDAEKPTLYPVFGPIEDLLLAILRDYFKDRDDVHVYERYFEGMELPAIVALPRNRSGVIPYETPEDRWVRSAMIELNTFAAGPEGSVIASELQEACRHALLEAWSNQTDYPGIGVLNMVNSSQYARPDTDWATSSHVQQYSRLPQNTVRYEAIYRVLVRPSRTFNNRFLSKPEGPN